MNFGGNRALDLAAERAEQEREAGLAEARRHLQRQGRTRCECGAPISALRRETYGAVRCLECQRDFEREQVMK